MGEPEGHAGSGHLSLMFGFQPVLAVGVPHTQETDGSGELDESGQPVTAPHPPAARTASTGMAPTGPLKDLLDSLQLAILPFPGCKVQPRLPPAGPVQGE
jgi:hypothetical protein